MRLEFDGEIVYWRGPSPYHFVAVPVAQSTEIHAVAAQVTYGWGAIPVSVALGGSRWRTSLFPRDRLYMLPVKLAIREAEGLELGGRAHVRVDLDVRY